MKNAGMAGAVALVGVGLITIGLPNRGDTAVAVSGFGDPDTICSQVGCPVNVFDSNVVLMDYPCPSNIMTWKPFSVSADLLGLGYDQVVILPSITGSNPTHVSLQIHARDGVFGMGFELRDLNFGDWIAGTITDATGVGLMDVDGDGRKDLLVAASDPAGGSCYDNVEVRWGYLRNIYDVPSRLTADLNGDGNVNGADLGELFVQWTG